MRRFALLIAALVGTSFAQDPTPQKDICPSGSTRYGPYRVATSSGAGTCLCKTNYLCSFDITKTVQDPLPSTMAPAMIYGAYFGAPGCGGKGLVYINNKLEFTSNPNGNCNCGTCQTGQQVKTDFFSTGPYYSNWNQQAQNKIRIASSGGSYCVTWFEYYICAVVKNKPPLCPDDPVTRTVAEVAARDAGCSGKGTNIGAPFLCSGPETDETVTYQITGGNDDDAFAINTASGQITVNTDDPKVLDFEVQPVRIINITATDNNKDAPLSTVKTVTITLTDCEDQPFVTDTFFSVDENSAVGTTVGTTIAKDEDSPVLTYQIIDGSDNVFSIDPTSGVVKVSGPVNYEVKSLYVLTIRATGDQNIHGDGKMTIQVNDVNDAPVIAPTFSLSVPENTNIGSPIGGALIANDEDRNPKQQLTYTIVSGSDGYFSISAHGGQVTLNKTVSINDRPSFTLVISVTDDGSPPASASTTVTVTVLDTNDAPQWVPPFVRSVNENSAIGISVGIPVLARDVDANDAVTYSIHANGGPFTIDPNSGQISVAIASLDYETVNLYTIQVRATDQQGASTDQIITINIIDVNDPPVFNNQVRLIDENSPLKTPVGAPLTVHDDDQPTTFTFKIADGNTGNAFSIDSSGQLLVATPSMLDYETTPKFSLIVTVSDGLVPVNATITVFLNDVNDPPVCAKRTLSVNENSPLGTLVGTVACTDPDAGDSVHHKLDGSSTTFAVDGSGRVTLIAAVLDYENVNTRQFVLNVVGIDSNLAETHFTVTINVLDVNEPPVWQGSTEYKVPVTAAIGDGLTPPTLLFVDPDTAQQQVLHYRIDNSNSGDPKDGSNFFGVDSASGKLQVIAGGLANPSVPSQFAITVIATDSGSPTGQTSVQIAITVEGKNVPPVCQDTTLTMREDFQDTVVGYVQCTDEEHNLLQYSITPTDNTTALYAFMLQKQGDGVNVVINQTTVDYERQPQYTYVLTAVEEENPNNTATAILTIVVQNVNEPPVIETSTLYVPPGVGGGLPVGDPIKVNDPEKSRVQITIKSGNPDGLFKFTGTYGRQLIVAPGKTVPYSPSRYPMDMEAKDATGLTYDRIVTVVLCDPSGNSSGLAKCPSSVPQAELGGQSSSSTDDTPTIIVAVVLGLLCIVLVVLIFMARRNSSGRGQVYVVNQGATKETSFDAGHDQTEINPAFDDPNIDETGGNFDEF